MTIGSRLNSNVFIIISSTPSYLQSKTALHCPGHHPHNGLADNKQEEGERKWGTGPRGSWEGRSGGQNGFGGWTLVEGGREEAVMTCCDSLANRQQCTALTGHQCNGQRTVHFCLLIIALSDVEQCSMMIVFVQCIEVWHNSMRRSATLGLVLYCSILYNMRQCSIV